MKYKIKILLALVLFITVIFTFNFCRKYCFKIDTNYSINTDPSYVRVYFDYATNSSLYEVYDFLQQDKDGVFFIKWDRIPHLDKKLSDYKNVKFLTYKHQYIRGELANIINAQPVKEYFDKHPDSKFIIYSNRNWLNSILPIIAKLPPNSVKEIHILEDGAYSSSYPVSGHKNTESDFIQRNNLYDYNLIYHVDNAKYLNSAKCLFEKHCREMKLLYKDRKVAEGSIKDLKVKLNKNQKVKDKYFGIYDFDYKKYKKEMVHPFGMYVFTLYDNHWLAVKELNFMNSITKGEMNYLVGNNKNIKWFYKEHPSLQQIGSFSYILAKTRPDMVRIPKHIPMELFLLADIVPDYIAGYSSSLFFNIPKKNISAFIQRPDDPYLYIIKREKMIRRGRIFQIDDIEKKDNKTKFKLLMSKFFVLFQ